MARDQAKARACKRRYLERKKIEKYGPAAAGVDMRGRHGHHAHAGRNARWGGGRFVTSHGYVAVRVAPDHPHAWGADPKVRYAYEHILVAEAAAGRVLAPDELVHHVDENKQNNEPANLEIIAISAHAKEHSERRGRDALGRFPPDDLRVREFPTVAR